MTKIWTPAQAAFLHDRSDNNPAVREGWLKNFMRWYDTTIEGAVDPLAKTDHWRAMALVDGALSPEDAAWVKANAAKPWLYAFEGGVHRHNLLVPPGLLSPAGVLLNLAAALDEYRILATMVLAGTLSVEVAQIPTTLKHTVGSDIHEEWRKRGKGRTDADFLRQDVEFDELLKLPDGEVLQKKDIERGEVMWDLLLKHFPNS